MARPDNLVWLGGLRVTEIKKYHDENETRKAGYVTLRPDNNMDGVVVWPVNAALLSRMRIGTRVLLAIGHEYFADAEDEG